MCVVCADKHVGSAQTLLVALWVHILVCRLVATAGEKMLSGCMLARQVLDARAIGAHLGPCKGYGFVTMASVDAAAAAIRCSP